MFQGLIHGPEEMSESHCKCSLTSQYPVLPEGAHIDRHPQDRNKALPFKKFPFYWVLCHVALCNHSLLQLQQNSNFLL